MTDATERGPAGRGGKVSVLALLALALASAGLLVAARRDEPRDRSAEAILADFEGVHYPLGVEGDDPRAQAAFLRAVEAGTREQARLALELYATHPTHAEVPRVMGLRWHLMRTNLGDIETVLKETAQVLDSDAGPGLRRIAHERRAHAAIWSPRTPLEEVLALVETALAVTDRRWGSWLQWDLALQRLSDPQAQRAVLSRMQGDFASPGWVEDARAHERLLSRIGEPCTFDFEDALRGGRVSAADLRGSEIVLLVVFTGGQIDALDGGPVRELAAWQASASVRQPQVVCVWQIHHSDLAAATARARDVTAQAGIAWRVALDCVGPQGGGWVEELGPAVTPLLLLVDSEGRLARASMRLATLLEE